MGAVLGSVTKSGGDPSRDGCCSVISGFRFGLQVGRSVVRPEPGVLRRAIFTDQCRVIGLGGECAAGTDCPVRTFLRRQLVLAAQQQLKLEVNPRAAGATTARLQLSTVSRQGRPPVAAAAVHLPRSSESAGRGPPDSDGPATLTTVPQQRHHQRPADQAVDRFPVEKRPVSIHPEDRDGNTAI